jgi:acyl dehydratase
MSTIHRTWRSAPSAPAYMLNAFRPSPGWRSERGCPGLRLAWHGYRVDSAVVDQLRAISGLGAADFSGKLGVLYPQVTGFRLVMAMLTHPAWPLPIWNALQVRNRLRLHAPIGPGEDYDLELRASGWRVLPKGVEIDLHASLTQRGASCWESIVTFYYRGRFGAEAEDGDTLGASPVSPVIPEEGLETARWRVGGEDRWRFAKLTGDYNGLHQWDRYARRMGFPAAFPHPQRVLAQCLARLPDAGPAPLQLDLWIKGPVFFGRDVTMRHRPAATAIGREFGLWLDGDARPALVGTLTTAARAVDQLAA